MFNVLSDSAGDSTAGKNLVQPKISQVFSKKRSLDDSDFPVLEVPQKKANCSSQPVTNSEMSHLVSSQPATNTETNHLDSHPGSSQNRDLATTACISSEQMGEGVSEKTHFSSAPASTPIDLNFSNELQVLGDLLSTEQATPKDKALISFLNKVCEHLSSSNKRITELTEEVSNLKEELGLQRSKAKKDLIQKSHNSLREEVNKSLKIVRIVGVKTEGLTNADIIKSTIHKLKDPSKSSPPSFEGVKVFKKQGCDVATVTLRCTSEESKLFYEKCGRKAGLKVRQNFPSTLVKTVSDLRNQYNTYAGNKNCYAMVKLGRTTFEIFTKSKKGEGGWSFLENLPYPLSKQQLKLNNNKQNFKSSFINTDKVAIPENY